MITSLFLYIYPYHIKKDISRRILELLNYDIHSGEMSDSVLLISSHTSTYDFLIGICMYYAYYDNYILYISIYHDIEVYLAPLLSFLEPRIKCIPIDSSKKMQTNLIEKILEHHSGHYILYIAPEGTYKCTDTIHRGYWYISQQLNISIVFLGIDYYLKKIVLEKERIPESTWVEEKKRFIESCSRYIPLYPELCYWTKDFYKMNA